MSGEIIWNPFLGKSPEEAKKLCRATLQEVFVDLPTRPTVPGEDAYGDGIKRVYTARSDWIIEQVHLSAQEALRQAGLDPDACFDTPAVFI